MSNRKGLVKTSTITVPKKQLKLNIDIDDINLWHVRITSLTRIFETPCRLSSLNNLFDLQKESWDVMVLGKWVNSDGRNFIKLDNGTT